MLRHIEERLSKTEKALLENIESLRDEVQTGFDQIAARLDDDDTERTVAAQVDRHEGWIQQLAKKTAGDLVIEA